MNQVQKQKVDWETLVAEQEKSRLTQKAFCHQRGLVLTQFIYHRCRLKNAKEIHAGRPSFKPVKVVKKDDTVVMGDIRLLLPNGFQCTFPSHLDPTHIKRLVEVLLSC